MKEPDCRPALCQNFLTEGRFCLYNQWELSVDCKRNLWYDKRQIILIPVCLEGAL